MQELTPSESIEREEAPAPAPAVWPPPPTNAAPPLSGPILPVFLPVRRLSRVILILLSVYAVLCVLCFGIALLVHPLSVRQTDNGVVSILQAFLLPAIGVCFLIWTYRLNRNLRAFGAEGLRFAPAWAAASFVIPILSIYRPVQVFREIWQASDPSPVARAGHAWQKSRTPALIVVWWASFFLMNIVDVLSSESPGRVDVDATDSAMGFVTSLLALQVVRLFSARQEETARLLHLA